MSFEPSICRALAKVFIEGILDWKMPIFRGLIYAALPALTAIYSGLQDYHSMSDLDALTWTKLALASLIASGTAIGAYLDSSFTRTKDRLNSDKSTP